MAGLPRKAFRFKICLHCNYSAR